MEVYQEQFIGTLITLIIRYLLVKIAKYINIPFDI